MVLRCAAIITVFFIAAVSLVGPTQVHAYDVRYSAITSPTGVSGNQSGYCPSQSGGHTMMPMTQSFQTAAYASFSAAAFSNAGIGGRNVFFSCYDASCSWVFTSGLMNGSTLERATFFKGVIYANSTDYTQSVPGMYNNFVKGKSPRDFGRAQDWVIPNMLTGGQWWNSNPRDFLFTQWVCEYYEFTASEAVTAPITDENGYIIEKKEEKGKFQWWIALAIAIGIVAIIVVIIVVICCCRKKKSDEKEEKEVAEGMRRSSMCRFPSQSQLARSRSGSIYMTGGGMVGQYPSMKDSPGSNFGSMRQPSMRQPSMQQPSMQQSPMRPPSMRQPSMRQPPMRQSSMRQPSMRQPPMRQSSMRQPSMRQPPMRQSSMRQPSMRQPPMRQPSMRQSSMRRGSMCAGGNSRDSSFYAANPYGGGFAEQGIYSQGQFQNNFENGDFQMSAYPQGGDFVQGNYVPQGYY